MTVSTDAATCRTEKVVRWTFHILCFIPLVGLIVLWSLPHDMMGVGAAYFGFAIQLGETILVSSVILTLLGLVDIVIGTRVRRGLRMAIGATILAASPAIILLVGAWSRS